MDQEYKQLIKQLTNCFTEFSLIHSVSAVNSSSIATNCQSEQHLRLGHKYCLRGRFKHNVNEGGGWGHKTGTNLCIYHPINLLGVEFRFVKLFNQGKELWQR